MQLTIISDAFVLVGVLLAVIDNFANGRVWWGITGVILVALFVLLIASKVYAIHAAGA